ncbi:MAG TPA: efflux RND transporter periplasmic adaptor subunit [Anaerolineales bacterium]|nr:efflux RND transporter periplasmic adaptor subunit [Anaerolineales bacterium]
MPHPNFPIRSLRVLLVFMLLPLFFAACSGASADTVQATPTAIPLPVIAEKPTYQVQRGELVSELIFSGRITPVDKQELAFAADGRVAKIYVRRGDVATKDQLLAELEIGQDEYALRRAQTNLKIAQLRLELARLQNPQTSEVNRINIAIPEQEVELAQIALDEINFTYDGLRLTSPIDGTVLSVSILEGTTSEANKPVIVVANLDDLVVSATVGSEDLARLVIGMDVTVSSIGRNIPVAEGAIRALPYPYGNADTESTDGSVQVALDQAPVQLGYDVGDMVSMSIILEQKADALWLPLQVVREFEGRYFVIAEDGDVERRVDVNVGIVDDDRIEITGGLAEGQVVVAP